MPKLLAQAANFGTGIQPVSPVYSPSADPAANLEVIISTGLGVMTVVGGLFFVVYFFLGALKWVTAGGDSGKVGKARDEMIQGVIGLIILVAAYAIVGLIGTIIGIDLLNVADTIEQIRPQ